MFLGGGQRGSSYLTSSSNELQGKNRVANMWFPSPKRRNEEQESKVEVLLWLVTSFRWGQDSVQGHWAGSSSRFQNYCLQLNSNFVCNPVMFIIETLQGLGKSCIFHRQNPLVKVAHLLPALFDPTYVLFPSFSSTFLFSSSV